MSRMATKGKVRDFIKLLHRAGFERAKAPGRKGDHRIFRNSRTGRRVEVDGKMNDDIHPKLWKKMMQDAGLD